MRTEYHDGRAYYVATYRGTEYCLSRLCDAWFVRTQRLALGRFNAGGGKHYRTLAEVAAGCRAFGSEADLTKAVFGIDLHQSAQA